MTLAVGVDIVRHYIEKRTPVQTNKQSIHFPHIFFRKARKMFVIELLLKNMIVVLFIQTVPGVDKVSQ